MITLIIIIQSLTPENQPADQYNQLKFEGYDKPTYGNLFDNGHSLCKYTSKYYPHQTAISESLKRGEGGRKGKWPIEENRKINFILAF